MPKLTKRKRLFQEKVEAGKAYSLEEAVAILQAVDKPTFSLDAAINLGVDSRKSDQVVRGATVLPAGTGKTVRVAVFAEGDAAKAAEKAGADVVGLEELAAEVKAGNMDFDVVIATPDTMRVVGQLGQILGPRGLMPNPKVGTVTPDVATAVKNAKSGQARFRTDKAGIIHASIGKVDFSAKDVATNLNALLTEVKRLKPVSAKGVYIKKITLSSTMGPGLIIDQSSLSV